MADATTTADRLEKKLDDQLAQLEKAQKTSLMIYIGLMVIIAIYFGVLNSQLKTLTNPKDLSEVAVGLVQPEIPKAREALASELKGNAEGYLNEALSSILAELPGIRQEVEKNVMMEVKTQLRKTQSQFNEFLDYAYTNHSEELRPLVGRLDNAESMEELESVMYDIMKEPLDHVDFKVDIEAYGLALQHLANKVERLRISSPDSLSKEDQMERDILVALRELSRRSN